MSWGEPVLYNRYLDRAVNIITASQREFDRDMALLENNARYGTPLPPRLTGDRAKDLIHATYQNDINNALRYVGRGLHPLQDIHAHGNFGNALFGHHVVDRYDIVFSQQRVRVLENGAWVYRYEDIAEMVWRNVRRADDPAYDWACERRISLVPAGVARGQRYLDMRAHTVRYLEEFLTQTGLRTCTRLREDQRVWVDPATRVTGTGAGGTSTGGSNPTNNGGGGRSTGKEDRYHDTAHW